MTKTKQLLFLMVLVLVMIIGFTLVPSDTPDATIDSPPTNEQGTTTPITVRGETPSIEPETLLVHLREAGVTDLNLETYTAGSYKGPVKLAESYSKIGRKNSFVITKDAG